MFRQVSLKRRTQKHEYFNAHQTPQVLSTAAASRLINPSLSFTFKHFQTKSHPNCTIESSHSILLYLETPNFNIFNLGPPNKTLGFLIIAVALKKPTGCHGRQGKSSNNQPSTCVSAHGKLMLIENRHQIRPNSGRKFPPSTLTC